MKITTRRLILRPLQVADIPSITRLANDKSIARWVGPISYPNSVLQTRKFVMSSMERGAQRKGPGDLLITLRSNPRIIAGCISLNERECGCYVLGYWMSRSYRKRGFVNEAAKALAAMAFEGGAKSITATFYAGNLASRRVMERLGMRRAGTAYGYSKFLGRKARLIVYRLTASRLEPVLD